ncbi:hypothetical protein MKK69_21445 [Methylobacterium sp. J-026]|uniref:NepR family anti-sigma factor n=1 Tax=Methylobacterium sp. J-026 TaxID=2836624 RepID=UPI001FB8F682|nr:NepR family anti-sigma factor [Methylobacterium sp. J-026]MCJ2136583.1 hypothetical protein [Methylobacterium sp. J-026]
MTGTKDERAIPGAAMADGPGVAIPQRAARASRRAIDAAVRDRIGRGLRVHYAGVLALPVPDRLRTLLDALAACSDTEAQP